MTDNDEKLIEINILQKFFKSKFKDDIYNAHSEKVISNNKDEFVLLTKEFSKQTIKDNSSEDEIYSPLSSEDINFIVDSKSKKNKNNNLNINKTKETKNNNESNENKNNEFLFTLPNKTKKTQTLHPLQVVILVTLSIEIIIKIEEDIYNPSLKNESLRNIIIHHKSTVP